jgi:hypothetical protein
MWQISECNISMSKKLEAKNESGLDWVKKLLINFIGCHSLFDFMKFEQTI